MCNALENRLKMRSSFELYLCTTFNAFPFNAFYSDSHSAKHLTHSDISYKKSH